MRLNFKLICVEFEIWSEFNTVRFILLNRINLKYSLSDHTVALVLHLQRVWHVFQAARCRLVTLTLFLFLSCCAYSGHDEAGGSRPQWGQLLCQPTLGQAV